MKLECRELMLNYGGNNVLRDLTSELPAGKITTVIGPNGSGKSTLLKAIGRLIKPTGGAVLLDGEEIHRLPTGPLARRLALLPQLHHGGDELTVEELVQLGRTPHATDRATNRSAVENALHRTGLKSLRHRPLASLSGGERQRAYLALTLAQTPELLLLDEPTTYLDLRCQLEVLQLIRRLNRELELTIVMILHDLNWAARYSDRLLVIGKHRIQAVGTPSEVLTPQLLHDVFGIKAEVLIDQDGSPLVIPRGIAEELRPHH